MGSRTVWIGALAIGLILAAVAASHFTADLKVVEVKPHWGDGRPGPAEAVVELPLGERFLLRGHWHVAFTPQGVIAAGPWWAGWWRAFDDNYWSGVYEASAVGTAMMHARAVRDQPWWWGNPVAQPLASLSADIAFVVVPR